MSNIPNTNSGHGHVWERPDGIKARRGGPSLCQECHQDWYNLNHSDNQSTDSQADDELAIVKLIDDIRALQLDFNDDVPYREGIELVKAYARRHTTDVLEKLKDQGMVYTRYIGDEKFRAVEVEVIDEAIKREQV